MRSTCKRQARLEQHAPPPAVGAGCAGAGAGAGGWHRGGALLRAAAAHCLPQPTDRSGGRAACPAPWVLRCSWCTSQPAAAAQPAACLGRRAAARRTPCQRCCKQPLTCCSRAAAAPASAARRAPTPQLRGSSSWSSRQRGSAGFSWRATRWGLPAVAGRGGGCRAGPTTGGALPALHLATVGLPRQSWAGACLPAWQPIGTPANPGQVSRHRRRPAPPHAAGVRQELPRPAGQPRQGQGPGGQEGHHPGGLPGDEGGTSPAPPPP